MDVHDRVDVADELDELDDSSTGTTIDCVMFGIGNDGRCGNPGVGNDVLNFKTAVGESYPLYVSVKWISNNPLSYNSIVNDVALPANV